MTEKWFNLATTSLDKEDKEQYTWPGRYNNKHGHIVLSKEKLVFVEEHGFFHTSASVLLDIPYDQIDTIGSTHPTGVGTRSQLEITTVDGVTRAITTDFCPTVKSHLEELMNQAKSEVAAVPAV